MMVTLNDFVARARATPCLSAKGIQNNIESMDNTVSERNVDIIAKATLLFRDSVSDLQVEVLPLFLGPMKEREYAAVFGYHKYRLVVRGLYDVDEQSIMLWFPGESLQKFSKRVSYRDAAVSVTGIVSLAVLLRGTEFEASWSCVLCIATPFQAAAELAIQSLRSINLQEWSDVPIQNVRESLDTSLRRLGLMHQMDTLVYLAEKQKHVEVNFEKICDILGLCWEEKEYFAIAYSLERNALALPYLPCVADCEFIQTVQSELSQFAWSTKNLSVNVPSRTGEIQEFLKHLKPPIDRSTQASLVARALDACMPLRSGKKSDWQALANSTVLANLNQQNGPFQLCKDDY